MHKDLHQLQKALKRQGWTITLTKNSHCKYRAPNGRIIVGAASPSDWRGIRNLKARLRQQGAKV